MLTAPPAPAGTIAALALVRPSNEFRVETTGWPSPVGQMVRYPSVPCGTTETFNEYAAALAGMLHPPSCGMGKFWNVPPGIGPLPPYCRRVSTNRHGVTATNCSGDGIGLTSCDSVPLLPE